MMSEKGFKYDVIKLLAGIKEHPALWDKTSEIYKDKLARKAAWDEICNMLDEEYEKLSWEEKRATVEYVVRKWANIRDTFIRSLKNKMGKPKKKYLLYNQLEFLLKVIPQEGPNEKYCYSKEQSSSSQELYDRSEETSKRLSSSTSSTTTTRHRTNSNEDFVPKKIKIERHTNNTLDFSQDPDYETYDSGINFVQVEPKIDSIQKVMNEDESFFASILPTIVKYNEDDKLEFRLGVLSLMKKIKANRNRQKDDDF